MNHFVAEMPWMEWSKREREATRIKKFKEWLIEGGARIDLVDIVTLKGFGRCIVATDYIPKGSKPIFIPERLCITPTLALKSVIGHALQGISVTRHIVALYLIYEKHNPTSPWKPYLDMLPKEFSTALYFSDREAEHLNGTSAARIRVACKDDALRLERIAISLSTKYPTYFPLKNFNRDNITWALSVVKTRTWHPCSLYPLLDLISHDDVAKRVQSEAGGQSLEIHQTTEKGQQIFVSYGEKSSSELLGHYGFIPYRQPSILPDSDSVDYFSNWYDALHHNLVIVGHCFQGEEISRETLNILQASLRKKFCTYPTTPEQDKKLMKKSSLSPNIKNAIQLRIQEKEIIEATMALVDQMLKIMALM